MRGFSRRSARLRGWTLHPIIVPASFMRKS
jgi:hypothetical protein